MGRLIVSAFMTVDGVMEAPGFEEHRSGRNRWALRLTDDEMRAWSEDLIRSAEAVLLGRTTYQIWAAFWPALRDEEPLGRRMNEVPKYVVSNSV
jgi:dihydrofolate reductase